MSDFVKDINVPTNDCISRQAAIEIVDRYNKSHMILQGKPMLGAASIVIELKALPSAQPERMKGKKIVKSNGRMGYWACDKCGETIHPDDNFCPNCGARLIEGVGLHDGNP